jgi:hypothetical protein
MASIEWIMMAAFLAALGLSVWKLYAFLPNQPLSDDDTTPEATERLMELMVRCVIELYESEAVLTPKSLFEQMVTHELFDTEHFWRFNPNRLNNLIIRYFTLNPAASTLEHIYELERPAFEG